MLDNSYKENSTDLENTFLLPTKILTKVNGNKTDIMDKVSTEMEMEKYSELVFGKKTNSLTKKKTLIKLNKWMKLLKRT